MSFCSKCGKELPAGAGFCPPCGNPVAGTSAALSTPMLAGAPVTAPNLATLGDRAVAVIIDHIILFVISLIIMIPLGLLGALTGGFGFFFGPQILVTWLIWLLYFSFFEGTTGQTLGKQVARIKVVDEASGGTVDMGRAFVRNILRVIDWLPFLYIIGIILVAVEEKRRRLGDMVANTVVVKT